MKKATLKTLFAVLISLFINAAFVSTAYAKSIMAMRGTWMMNLTGVTGAGQTVISVKMSLVRDENGNLVDTAASNIQVTDGGAASSIETFIIDASQWDKKTNTGKANLSCGNGCGYNFDIQLSKNGQILNLTESDNDGPGKLLVGTAVKQ